MKRILYTFIFVFSILTSIAQNEYDALRYSQTFHNGSARFVSMGGAFGALGGDFSSISYNPAGLGVYRSSEFIFTPTFNYNKVKSNFIGTSMEDSKYRFGFNNIGFVSSYKANESSPWVNFNFAIGYNKHNTFNDKILISGIGYYSSMLDNFTTNINNGIWDANYEDLAYETYLINPSVEDSTVYDNVITNSQYDGYNQYQQHIVSKKGSIGELLLSFGANYNHQLYLGATVGIYTIRYEQNIEHYEEDDLNVMDDFNSFRFRDDFKTFGTGFTFKFGAIYKPIEMLRIGAAVHLPTLYELEDEYKTSMSSSFDNGDDYTAYSQLGISEYSLTTPFKFLTSVAWQLQKKGLISLDYELIDYSNMSLNSSYDEFYDINQGIEDAFTLTHNIRAGGEYRINNIFSFRAGYAYYDNPFADGLDIDGSFSILSTGFGIRSDEFYLDLAYSYKKYNEDYYMYNDYPYLDPANLKFKQSKFIATLGFRF